MNYRRGDHVLHPHRPEWGVGRILSAQPNGVLEIDFRDVGRKSLHMGRVSFTLERVDPGAVLYAGLARDQQDAVKAVVVKGEPVVLVTGAAGTGKSHVIKRITDKTTLVVAPTGLAALNVAGVTLHRAFGLPLGVIQASSLPPFKPELRKVLERIDRLVIDEVSMVRVDVLDAVDQRLRDTRKSPLPFGGVQVVLVGDPYQLPPVVRNEEKHLLSDHQDYKTFHFFSSRVLKANPPRHYELQVQHRQREGGDFLEILNRLRRGTHSQDDLRRINQRAGQPHPQSAVILSARNQQVGEINETRLAALPGPRVQFDSTGTWPGREKPAEENLILAEGARVVLLRNDPEGSWVNGSQGTVQSWTNTAVKVALDDGGVVSVERSRWELSEPYIDEESNEIRYRLVGEFSQFPLRLGWALTIHRCQGMTLRSIVVDLGAGSFERGQTYVALSRVRRLEDLVLAQPLRDSDIRTDPVIADFFAWLDRRASSRGR
jgi:ATP-dependent DNA helicase PIF1